MEEADVDHLLKFWRNTRKLAETIAALPATVHSALVESFSNTPSSTASDPSPATIKHHLSRLRDFCAELHPHLPGLNQAPIQPTR